MDDRPSVSSDDLRIYRRRLPHWRLEEAVYFVTWRLAGGARPLCSVERQQLADVLRYFDGTRYQLLAYVIMNDHIHALVQPHPGCALERLVHSWKSFSTRLLQRGNRRGRIWQREYYDRILRNEDELRQALEYILTNPRRRWPETVGYPWVWCRRDLLG